MQFVSASSKLGVAHLAVSPRSTPSSPTIKPLTGLLRSNASTGLSKDQIPLRALALEYRLSHVASLPGIIADALAGWKFLIHDCGYAPESIVLAGDSAGGKLTIRSSRVFQTLMVCFHCSSSGSSSRSLPAQRVSLWLRSAQRSRSLLSEHPAYIQLKASSHIP